MKKAMQTKCPVCSSRTQVTGKTATCRCGWYKSFNQQIEMTKQKGIAKNIFLFACSLLIFIGYFGYWGGDSIRIVPLKVKQWTGKLDKDSFMNLKNICMKGKKYNCVESAYLSYFRSSGDLGVLASLANFQFRRNKKYLATHTYYAYFSKKGRSVKAAYNYARLLEEQGDSKSAIQFYNYAMKASPSGVIQMTVARAYINLLIKSGQKRKARIELLKMNPFFKNASAIYKQEYDRWSRKVNRG